MGDFTLGQKILAACFQSVTTRTAGFATISQKGLTTPSVVVTLFLMFTGGSPVSTAGGVKTTTIAIIILTVVATVRGREDVTCFKRRIPEKTVRKALAVVLISFMASVVAIIAMMLFEKGEAVDQIFEIYSALGTVGITRDYTSVVGLAGKIILCICMYLGRIGPITMVLVFTMRDKQTMARLPEENVTVG
jgi:trk system potassium uptake protein TrkH